MCDMHCVLAVEKKDVPFQNDAFNFKAPDGQAVLEAELSNVVAWSGGILRAARFIASYFGDPAIRQPDPFTKVI